MALPIQGFVTPEQDWAGLTNLSRNMRQDKLLQEQERRRQDAQKAASAKFLTDYLDQEQFLTGTPNDPYITEKVNTLMREGADLINKGVDNSQLLMALSPKVGRLSKETQILKGIAEQRKQAKEILSKNPAIDINKFDAAFNDVFFETDENGVRKVKDISRLDPNVNYADLILNSKNVYTPAGVDKFMQDAKVNTINEEVTVTDAKGAKRKAKLEVSRPDFMQLNVDPKTGEVDKEQKFIPKYDIAQDGDQPILADFMTKQGETVKAPVRLLNQDVFRNLMRDKDAAAYILAEARDYAAANGIPMNDARMELFSRALAYDLVKNSTKDKSTYKELTEQKAAPAPRVSVNVGGGGSKEDIAYNDTYGLIYDYVTSTQTSGGKGAAFVGLPLDAQNVVMEFVNKGKGEYDKKKAGDIYLREEGGKIYVMDASKKFNVGQKPPSDAYLGELPKGAINVRTTQGQERKIEAEQDAATGGGRTPAPKPKPNPTANTPWDKYKR